MHQPRPHGLHVEGGALTDEDSAAIELLARRLTNLKTLSGVDSLRMVRSLPGGGYVIAQDMGGTFRTIAHKPVPDEPELFDGVATAEIPTLYSGVVTEAILRGDVGLGMKLTEQTRKRLSGYGENDMPPKDVRLQRFRIGYHSLFSEFEPDNPGMAFHTQYAQQRPTWYSGAMAEVMQIVGGYGRQDFDRLPDNPVERARMVVPEKYMRRIRLDLGNVRLPGYTGKPPRTGQFQYDYKFHNTNAVAFDGSDKPWLVRVSPAGVFVMPLPLVPATTTRAFREYIEEVGDEEIRQILDRFGGMPSGESFPMHQEAFEAWRRAGVIIKVCDTADFYDHIMYASACGWSFNTRGTEGYNTCYDYYDDEGLGYGLTYKIQLRLGSAVNDGKLPQSFDLDDPDDARALDAYLSSIYRQLRDTNPEHLAIKYKIRRVPVGQLLARARSSGQGEVEYWNRLELEPIASHSGSVTEVGRGYLYHGAIFEYQPQIKFPEPFMGGCVSHDFLPLFNGRYKSSYPNCDTIMFCYYDGDDLKVVKYFRDDRSYTREVESDFEDCMTVGSWTQVVTSGQSVPTGYFYTTDIDDRKVLSPVVETTRVVGRDLGFDHTPFFAFDAPFWRPGSMWRNRYFSRQTNVERTEGHSLDIGVCIPYLHRNALLSALREGVTGKFTSERLALHSVRDPTSYRYWTYDFIMHWTGGLPVMNGKPSPKDGSPVWVEIMEYNPTACSDFADEGDWVGQLPADYTWLIHPVANVWKLSGGGGAPHVNAYYISNTAGSEQTGSLKASIQGGVQAVHSNVPSNLYFLGSPSLINGVFYRDACQICFGEMEYASVSETVSGGQRRFWGFTSLATHKTAHHFIGVINE